MTSQTLSARLSADLEALDSSQRFSNDQLEAVYTMAYNLYTSARYGEALGYFAFLTLYQPTERRYLFGLASTQHMAKNYEGAIQSYAFLTMLDPEDPGPTLHIGECLMMLGQTEDARESLAMVIAMANASGGRHAVLKGRAEGLLTVLDQIRN